MFLRSNIVKVREGCKAHPSFTGTGPGFGLHCNDCFWLAKAKTELLADAQSLLEGLFDE